MNIQDPERSSSLGLLRTARCSRERKVGFPQERAKVCLFLFIHHPSILPPTHPEPSHCIVAASLQNHSKCFGCVTDSRYADGYGTRDMQCESCAEGKGCGRRKNLAGRVLVEAGGKEGVEMASRLNVQRRSWKPKGFFLLFSTRVSKSMTAY